jgi:hypothetical protein
MNSADKMAAKIEPSKRLTSGATGSIDKLDEQLRVSVEALLHPSPPRPPVEEIGDLLSAINHHLDEQSSEREAIHRSLVARARLAKVRPLSGRHLYRGCRHLALAILRRSSKADDRDKNLAIWLVAGDQADDRELGHASAAGSRCKRRQYSENARRFFS